MGSSSIRCPQQDPPAIKWYSMTRSAPGITVPAIAREGGASATHGEVRSKSKYTAPVSRTARRTSESTSVLTTVTSRSGRMGSQVGPPGKCAAISDDWQDKPDDRSCRSGSPLRILVMSRKQRVVQTSKDKGETDV